MSDKEKERLALRAIAVSTSDALNTMSDDPGRLATIRDRADELLSDLESRVIRDGGDATILAAIDTERRRLHA
jgi:hypothetical protein